MNKKRLYILSLLSGVLLWLGWPAKGFPFLLLIGFVPLLIIEEMLYRERGKQSAIAFFKYAYIAMLLWNILTTWWIWNATAAGAVAAIVCNALFMALVLLLFHYVRIKTSTVTGYASLIFFWLSFEYLHLNWELSWPWLTLGNGFANYAGCVQWYEYTGVLGGTLWILTCNVFIFRVGKCLWLAVDKRDVKSSRRTVTIAIAITIIALPLLISALLPFKERSVKKVSVVVVQPNIDPYHDKFNGNYLAQVKEMLKLADTKVDSATDYLVFPETALTEDINENHWNESFSVALLNSYLSKHSHISLITGAETYKIYPTGAKTPASAHKMGNSNQYYDDYNTALEFNHSLPIQVYHKSKLVPGVEVMPFQKVLAPIAKLAFDLGGTSGTLGTQKEPSVFYSPYSKTTAGVVVCYESIYGGYISKFVQKGAQILFIITNDGWWKNTPGYKQHFCYARLLAIETRRCIAQSANTGISGFIDEKGHVLQHTGWWYPTATKALLNTYTNLTFYVVHGDYIGWLACICSALVLLIFFIFLFIKRKTIQ